MKWLPYALAGLILMLQLPLWFGDGSLPNSWQIRTELQNQKLENEKLSERNEILKAEVLDLKTGGDAIEERARSELGMIRKDETFYQIVEGSK